MNQIFICKIKIIGSPFAVLTEEEAKQWVSQDSEINYYEIVPIKTIELSNHSSSKGE